MGTDASQNRQPSVFGLLAAAGGHSSYEGVPPARAMQSGVVRTDCRGRWRRGSVTEWHPPRLPVALAVVAWAGR
jgi:hypothetical protein